MPEKMQTPLPEYFDAEDKGTEWHLFCKTCGRGWAFPKDAAERPGVLLPLLNHAHSHKETGG